MFGLHLLFLGHVIDPRSQLQDRRDARDSLSMGLELKFSEAVSLIIASANVLVNRPATSSVI